MLAISLLVALVVLCLSVSKVVFASSASSSLASPDCSSFSDCVSCTDGGKYNSCFWCESSSLTRKSGCTAYNDIKGLASCGGKDGVSDDGKLNRYRYEDTCPVKFPVESTFLSYWMGRTMGAIKVTRVCFMLFY